MVESAQIMAICMGREFDMVTTLKKQQLFIMTLVSGVRPYKFNSIPDSIALLLE